MFLMEHHKIYERGILGSTWVQVNIVSLTKIYICVSYAFLLQICY